MARIRVPVHYLYDPFDSKVTNFRIEPGNHCDGKRCGLLDDEEAAAADGSVTDEEDEVEPVPPHFHLIIWGEEPRTALRCMPFSGDMPDELLALLPESD